MASAGALIGLVAAIIALGVISQVLGDRFRVPSIIFLLSVGLILGPLSGFVLESRLITIDTFGDALPVIVGFAVAIIVFEGAFHLRIDRLRTAPSATLKLVTIGSVISLVGTAAAVRYALGAPWDVAFLVGSLLIATGPTVIAPILQVVPVRDRVGTALETEGIINDVTAAILAVVVFEVVIVEDEAGGSVVTAFAEKLGIGILVGLIVAAVLWYGLRYVDLSPSNAPRNARLLVLAGALVAYAGADSLSPEAGIAAVATAGIVLGNLDIPYEADITDFGGDITLLVLSFVFIALAALLNVGDLLALGVGGLVVVVVVALVLRPVGVALSTRGDRFTREEKMFVSFIGPRGIIPASVATLFAVQLRDAGLVDAATILVGTVFLVIFATVLIQGGFARYLAEYLDVIPMRVIIVGGGRVGRALAERLEQRGENVVIVDNRQSAVEQARDAGHTAQVGDGTDTDVLRTAGAENAKILAAATGDDDVNLLVAQFGGTTFGIEDVIARVNQPENADAFEDLGVRTISSSLATAWAIDNAIERPALSNWMTELDRSGDVQEIEITAEDVVGRSVAELGTDLPDGSLIALVGRDGDSRVPDREVTVEHGDHVTVIGHTAAVQTAIDRLHPHE
ncbi:cation:proton antiporter domain-containing protein [Halococcus salifodinae]|uniref:TrkA-N domain-containing protein n=1 Tax=Halococcus salifodinae DSM 8989 TaxID=1227456 RepID=M0ND20_9EURY|nr:cation:proton antiporter [Halococcus salifodinae]EMA55756.1 TrkA-N domain-containing protein [Halococcus salifodinae DSM 8989]